MTREGSTFPIERPDIGAREGSWTGLLGRPKERPIDIGLGWPKLRPAGQLSNNVKFKKNRATLIIACAPFNKFLPGWTGFDTVSCALVSCTF